MRLAISNIAWDVNEDEAVATLLQRYAIDAIDVAPTKYFAHPAVVTEDQLRQVRRWWSTRGFEITGMQALMFGTTGLNVFGSRESQSAMLAHLAAICRIGDGLNARKLVFGSPKNRDCSGLTSEAASATAISFFRQLGDIAARWDVTICLEPNPREYNANFMTTVQETARVVRDVDHPSIRLQFDVGAGTINNEDPETTLRENANLVAHIHASEPNLLPLGDGGTNHHQAFKALVSHLPEHVVSIEMLATPVEPHLASINRALAVAIRAYRGPSIF